MERWVGGERGRGPIKASLFTNVMFLVVVKYMTITLFLVALSLIINVLLLSMHQRGPLDDNVPLPPWARDLFLHKLAYLVGMSSYITPDDEHAAMVAQVVYEGLKARVV